MDTAAVRDQAKRRLSKPAPSFRLRSESLNTLRLRRIFDLFDGNGDGVLTSAELCSALDRLGLGADPSDLTPLINSFISPGNSGLSFDDFRSLHLALGDSLLGPEDEEGEGTGAADESDMVEAFKVFDEDGDGFISAVELQKVLGKLGLLEGKNIDRVKEMIGSVDVNSDGQVDYQEFKHMMEGIAVNAS